MTTATTDQGDVVIIPRSFGKYSYVRMIGAGSTSVVALVKDGITQYAAKFVPRSTLANHNALRLFEAETRIHQSLHHPNIVRLFDVIYLKETICLVLEYCDRRDLVAFLALRGTVNDQVIERFYKQILDAVLYLHSRSLAHRDIKLENIFVDQQMNLKLGDFGTLKLSNEDNLCSTIVGTEAYSAPEIMIEDYDAKMADVWSLGITLYAIATGCYPWPVDTQTSSRILKIPDYVNEKYAKIVQMALRENPNERASIFELRKVIGPPENPRAAASDLKGRAYLGQFSRKRDRFNQSAPLFFIHGS